MNFGIDLFPVCYPASQSGEDYFRQSLDLCELADTLGYNRVKVIEHYSRAYGGYSPSPSTLLAAISQRTKRMRLITGAVVPAFNHPLKLAGELAMVDCLSNGRLDVGVARAFLPHEYDAFGVSLDESRPRFEEGIQALIRLWTEEEVTFEGRFHRLERVTSLPKVVQKPHPPIWITAVASRESFIWAGQQGYKLMMVPYLHDLDELAEHVGLYRSAYREGGHDPKGEDVIMVLHLHVAEDRKTAVAQAKAPMELYLSAFRESAAGWLERRSPQYRPYEKLVERIDAMSYDRIVGESRALVGDPHDVAQQLNYFRELFGKFEPTFQVNFGNMGESQARHTLELFAQHVMPQFANI